MASNMKREDTVERWEGGKAERRKDGTDEKRGKEEKGGKGGKGGGKQEKDAEKRCGKAR